MNNLRFPFNHMPKWLLVAFLATIGLPLHLAIGLWAGLCIGVDTWRWELRELRAAQKQLPSRPPIQLRDPL